MGNLSLEQCVEFVQQQELIGKFNKTKVTDLVEEMNPSVIKDNVVINIKEKNKNVQYIKKCEKCLKINPFKCMCKSKKKNRDHPTKRRGIKYGCLFIKKEKILLKIQINVIIGHATRYGK